MKNVLPFNQEPLRIRRIVTVGNIQKYISGHKAIMTKQRKNFIIICSVFISVTAFFLLHHFTTVNKAESYFKWISGNPKDRSVQVSTGKTVVLPIEFRVGAHISGISLAIRDESLQRKGIFLEDSIVPVRNGTASSKVIFNIRPGSGLKAGHYYLTIIARDTATGNTIREGEIPFALDMLDLIWKCSC
jgi:hypothetical protein